MMESQFLQCEHCKINKKCCKIVSPVIFGFERSKFKNFIFFDNFKGKKIPLLKKKNKSNECIFLKNNLCSIYEKRPFNCKMFPFDIIKNKTKILLDSLEILYCSK